jgi:endonuclease-3
MAKAKAKPGAKKPRKAAARQKAKTRKAPPKRTLVTAAVVGQIGEALAALYPKAVVELDHTDAYQLLVATILSAQSTDRTINTITPALFARYPDARALAASDPADVEPMVRSSGYYRVKAGYIIAMARAVVERHGGEIPRTMDELCALPGVARKTANVVLGEAMGIDAGFVVDTHVTRLVDRLAMSRNTDPVKIEEDMLRLVPEGRRTRFAQRLIWHGRRVCDAKAPACDRCTLAPLCASAFAVMKPPPKKATRPAAKRRRGHAR